MAKSKKTKKLARYTRARKKNPDFKMTHGASHTKECIINVVEDGDHFKVEVKISAKHAEEMTKAFWRFYSKNIRRPGFRDGKMSITTAKKLKMFDEGMMNMSYSQYANIKYTESAPRKVILTADHEVKGTTITFTAWLEPEVKLSDDDFNTIMGNTLKIPMFDEERYVDERLRSFAKFNPYLRNKEDAQGNPISSADGDMAEVQVTCTVGGEVYKEGCEEATNIRIMKEVVQPASLYDKLVGVMPGHAFSIETNDIPKNWGKDLTGKTMKLDVKIIRIYSCEESKVDDDMAVTAGFKDLADWKRSLQDSAHRAADSQNVLVKKNLVLATILDRAVISDFPVRWLDEKVKELASTGESNIKEKVHEVAKHSTILKKVGSMLDVEWDDGDKVEVMRDENNYVQKVLNVLIDKVKFEYVKQLPPEAPKRNPEIATQAAPPSDGG
jgi:FKBP-type peptidyl-prolyl cis-trans isomerase (trigger factor)